MTENNVQSEAERERVEAERSGGMLSLLRDMPRTLGLTGQLMLSHSV